MRMLPCQRMRVLWVPPGEGKGQYPDYWFTTSGRSLCRPTSDDQILLTNDRKMDTPASVLQ